MSASSNTRPDGLLYATVNSTLGTILLAGNKDHLMYLDFPLYDKEPTPNQSWTRDQTRFANEIEQLEQYFAGDRSDFDVPLAFDGGSFNNQVWTQLTKIPFGEVITYGELARRVGQPDGAQAVGNANGKNPIPIIIPCHRVIAAKNNIGGFTGGVDKKQLLLKLEKAKNVQFDLF